MATPAAYAPRHGRALILVTLLGLAGLAWAALIWQAHMMGSGAMGLTMGMDAALFIAIWVVMMVAMMFPAAAPMILMFAAIQRGKRRQGRQFVPTWLFVAAYLLVWTLFGVLAYLLALGLARLADHWMWLIDNAARIGGIVVIAAGLYQLSPLKHSCLAKCRTPMQVILTTWRDGYRGAFRMGLSHGAYCLGCCWLLFVILFPLGVMNLAAMAALTALIYVEKSLPVGQHIARLAALVLVAYGTLVLFIPSILPTAM
jgi:predicted metal-binding membrane protein